MDKSNDNDNDNDNDNEAYLQYWGDEIAAATHYLYTIHHNTTKANS